MSLSRRSRRSCELCSLRVLFADGAAVGLSGAASFSELVALALEGEDVGVVDEAIDERGGDQGERAGVRTAQAVGTIVSSGLPNSRADVATGSVRPRHSQRATLYP